MDIRHGVSFDLWSRSNLGSLLAISSRLHTLELSVLPCLPRRDVDIVRSGPLWPTHPHISRQFLRAHMLGDMVRQSYGCRHNAIYEEWLRLP